MKDHFFSVQSKLLSKARQAPPIDPVTLMKIELMISTLVISILLELNRFSVIFALVTLCSISQLFYFNEPNPHCVRVNTSYAALCLQFVTTKAKEKEEAIAATTND